MSSKRFSKIMNRKSGEFDSVLNSLSFSSSADNNIVGLDEALQEFAVKKAQAVRRRRGPIEGIPDDSISEQFEIAEDAMLSAQVWDDDTSGFNLSRSAPANVSHPIIRINFSFDKIPSSAPVTGIQSESSNSPSSISVNSPSSSRRQRRSTHSSRRRHRRHRPRTASPSGTDHTPSDHLKSSDIVTQSLGIRPSSTAHVLPPANVLRSTYPHLFLKSKKSEEGVGTMNSGVSSSLPDLHKSGSGSLRFERSVLNNEAYSKNPTTMDNDKVNDLFEHEALPTVTPLLPPKRPSRAPAPPVPASQPFGFSSSSPTTPSTNPPATTGSTWPCPPTNPTSDSSFIPPSAPLQEQEVLNKPDRPLRRPKKPSSGDILDEGMLPSGEKKFVDTKSTNASAKAESLKDNAIKETVADEGQFSDSSESSKAILFGLITEDLMRLFKRNTLLVLTVLFFTILFIWYFSICPFLAGALVGGGCVYIFMRFWNFTMRFLNTYSPDYHPEDCIFTRGGGVNFPITTSPTATCCSLHNSLLADWRPAYAGPLILPPLRELQAPPVPRLADEDPKTGPAGGHLAEGLGFKLDKNNKPLYQTWMNETVSYSSETYHINDTHSVFVTLEGLQLRIQRPRKNVPRRAMFNVSVPSSSGVQFVHQRIYNMRNVTVSLLPEGLVAKRLWSKKYPICLTIQSEQNSRSSGSQDTFTKASSSLRSKKASSAAHSGKKSIAAYPPPTDPNREESKSAGLDSQSAYSVSTSRFVRVSTNPTFGSPTTGSISNDIPKSQLDEVLAETQDDFLLVQPSDLDDKIYLFTRTCREKETWFRRLYGASIGKPLLLTTQQAFKQLELNSTPRIKLMASRTKMQTSASFSDITTSETQAANTNLPPASALSNSVAPLPVTNVSSSIEACYDPELQVEYLRYMAKFIPAPWLSRAIQALKLNLNFVKTDSQLPWFNAFFGRLAWDVLRHERWRRRIQERIQAKIKKMKLVSILNEPIVTNVEMGNECPVVTNISRPYMDNQGLWLELELVYTGGFTVALETTVNTKKLEKLSRQNSITNQTASSFAGTTFSTPAPSIPETTARNLAAFLSEEEDSADSSTDSERETTLTRAFVSFLPTSNPPVDLPAIPSSSNNPNSSGNSHYKLPAEVEDTEGSPNGASKGRFHRIFDRITRSLYVQMADSKLVQYSLDLVTQTTLHLKLEITMLHGNLVLNIPPPPSNRLWYGFRNNPNFRLKVRPKVGEYLFNFPRILETIEKKIITEFQRVLVLPNMDDLVLSMLFPEENLDRPNTAESKSENSQTDATPIPPQHLLQQKSQDTPKKVERKDDTNSNEANTST
nr:hypothetical transcript [Hymenolepis microstoma]